LAERNALVHEGFGKAGLKNMDMERRADVWERRFLRVLTNPNRVSLVGTKGGSFGLVVLVVRPRWEYRAR
jgi:hypothetical protein